MKDNFFANIEPVAGVLRVFQDGMIPGVDPYEFAATVVYHDDGESIELKGITSKSNNFLRMREAICKVLYDNNIKKLIWDRHLSNGQIRRIEFEVEAYMKRRD